MHHEWRAYASVLMGLEAVLCDGPDGNPFQRASWSEDIAREGTSIWMWWQSENIMGRACRPCC